MDNKTALISIVIPVYNLSRYIGRCIDSVIRQTYRNIEIILVDDGSTDDSLMICNKYAQRDSRIRVITKENGGPASARNTGIDYAKGEYIANIDGDDILNEEYISYLYNLIVQNDVDMSICEFAAFSEIEELEKICNKKSIEKVLVMNKEEALETLLYQKYYITSNWCRLYKSYILKNEKFLEGNCADDVATNHRFIMRANRVAYGTKKLYYYYQRKDSIIHSWVIQRERDCERASRDMYELVKAEFPNLEAAAASKFFSANVQILAHISFVEIYDQKHEIILKNIKEFRFKVLCDKKSRKVNRLVALASYGGMWLIRLCLYAYRA